MTKRKAEILLILVIMSRSTAMLFSKLSLSHMGVFNLLSLRFMIAFVLLIITFHKRIRQSSKNSIFKGALLGTMFFLVMTAELNSIKTTPTTITSFLENTAIIMVPILSSLIYKKKPTPEVVISSAIALFGVGLLTLKSNIFFSKGELLGIVAALIYSIAILTTDKVSKNDDPLVIGIFQVGFLGFFSTIATFFVENPTVPNSPLEWVYITVLALICTFFGFTLQPVAQKYTTPEITGLFCAINPAFTSILGVVFLKEKIDFWGIIGSILILFSIFIPYINQKIKQSLPKNYDYIYKN